MFDILRANTNDTSSSSSEPRRHRRQKFNTYMNYYNSSIDLSSKTKGLTNSSETNSKDVTDPEFDHEDYDYDRHDGIKELRKRNLLRDILFGIEDNLEPCIEYDRNIFYKFLITPYQFGKNKQLYRNFISEIVENNDMVEFQHLLGTNYTQETVLNWVKTQKDYNITFDHLVLMDESSIVNLEMIEYNLLNKGYQDKDNEKISAKLPNIIWGNFETPLADNMVIIGEKAFKTIIENKEVIKNSKYSNLITQAYFYIKEKSQTLSNKLEEIFFINDPEGFILWTGKIEEIPQITTIGVGKLQMTEDFNQVTEHLSISYVPVCHFTTSSEGEPKIAVVTSSSFKDRFVDCKQSIIDIAFESIENKRIYAQEHRYPIIPLQTYRRGMITWGNIDTIKMTLPYYDWILWIDTNSVITNYNVSLSEMIKKFYLIVGKRIVKDDNIDESEIYKIGKETFDKTVDIVVAEPTKEEEEFNAGMLLFKHSGWSFGFIRNVQALRNKRMKEEGVMWKLLEEFPEFKQRMLLLSHEEYPLSASPKYWKEGDFILNYGSENCPAGSITNSLKKLKETKKNS
ncbi:24142_t:CDS:2 [Cetraspora pellucida]|uniref:24142_t:CDS:1 n=1 Tax=Cetraspora pellucida TaxID=1433469 RepID=A0A9N9AEB5_9GLOM|nr:24142_t:CDS:2 [Cetraspora pellucida]